MSTEFIGCDRETPYLLPPSLLEWLPERHLARFVVEIVDHLNLQPLKDSYRGEALSLTIPQHAGPYLAAL